MHTEGNTGKVQQVFHLRSWDIYPRTRKGIRKIGNSRFIYAQSSLRKHHLNYFNHVLELFKPYISKDFIVKDKPFTDKRTNANYSSVQFATLTLPCFNHNKSTICYRL
jgi:hypothetical protein